TPAAVLSAIAAAARSGVLFKGGVTVEEASQIRVIAFDKTGTLTAGKTRLTDVVPLAHDVTEHDLIGLAAAAQARSEHHLAHALLREAETRQLEVAEASRFLAVPGRGVEATVGGRDLRIGNPAHFEHRTVMGLEEALTHVDALREKTAVIVTESAELASGERVLGVMAFADTLRPDARRIVARLKALGIEHVAILTGDAQSVGEAVGVEVGADAVYAELLPEQKVEVIRQLEADYGAVAMIGDGVNDAPALATATLGIAMGGAGTDVALETADVVLMADDLNTLPFALRLSQRTRRTLAANLAISFGMIAVMIASILTVGLPLPLAVVGHEGSTVVVSLNGLRLLGARN
ncbi:MAG: HAD-IC family P-type ATPase, partial [Bacteroidota bacterium]